MSDEKSGNEPLWTIEIEWSDDKLTNDKYINLDSCIDLIAHERQLIGEHPDYPAGLEIVSILITNQSWYNKR